MAGCEWKISSRLRGCCLFLSRRQPYRRRACPCFIYVVRRRRGSRGSAAVTVVDLVRDDTVGSRARGVASVAPGPLLHRVEHAHATGDYSVYMDLYTCDTAHARHATAAAAPPTADTPLACVVRRTSPLRSHRFCPHSLPALPQRLPLPTYQHVRSLPLPIAAASQLTPTTHACPCVRGRPGPHASARRGQRLLAQSPIPNDF